MMKPARLPLVIATSLALALVPSIPASQAGSLHDMASDMFNGMANVTAPQAFKGQTMNTYTAGSMFLRVPNKTYQVLSAQAPYLRSGGGCSGIDAFTGSFSHIGGAEFKEMLKGITSALPGLLFQLAIKSVEPLMGSTMEWFQSISTMVNRANISSCEAAKGVIYDTMDLMGYSSTKRCEAFAMMGNKDAAQAREHCKERENVKNTLEAAKADPNKKEEVPFRGNLIWASLKRMTHLDNADRETIMSITGTTIYPPAYDGQSHPTPWAPSNLTTATLLYGDGGVCGANEIQVLSCGADTDECLNPAYVCRAFTPMRERVADIMASLSSKIRAGDQAPDQTEINFVNNVPVQVYRILAAGNTLNNSAISESYWVQFLDYVAVEFVHAMMSRMISEAKSVDLHNSKLLTPQMEQLGRHTQAARAFMNQLNADRQVAAQKAQVVTTIIEQVSKLERDLRAAMPQQVRDLLAYSALR